MAHPPFGHAISIAVRTCSSRFVLCIVIMSEAENSLNARWSSGESASTIWSTTSSVAESSSSSDVSSSSSWLKRTRCLARPGSPAVAGRDERHHTNPLRARPRGGRHVSHRQGHSATIADAGGRPREGPILPLGPGFSGWNGSRTWAPTGPVCPLP